MKSIRIFLLLIMVGVFILPNQTKAQVSNSQSALGVGIKASTNGFGIDIIYALKAPVTFRLGIEKLGYQAPIKFDEQGIKYSGNLDTQTGSISFLADYYFTNNFFITAGLARSLLKIEFEGEASESFPFGDIEIPVDMIGDFNFIATPKSAVMPYFGLGVGRTLGLNKEFGFAFEAGTFYQGLLGIDIESTGLLSPTSNPDHGHAERLEKQINQYTWYPICKVSLSYKLITF